MWARTGECRSSVSAPRPWWWAVHLAAALRQASGAQRGRNRLRLRRLAYELQDCHCFFLLLSPPQARAVVPFPSGMERVEQAQALPAAGASTMGSAWQQGHKIGCIYCWRRWSHQGSAYSAFEFPNLLRLLGCADAMQLWRRVSLLPSVISIGRCQLCWGFTSIW